MQAAPGSPAARASTVGPPDTAVRMAKMTAASQLGKPARNHPVRGAHRQAKDQPSTVVEVSDAEVAVLPERADH